MSDAQRFTRVDFEHFKAFDSFTLNLRHFNILVGPNNAGKSTILTAFRILASAMRKANHRKPEVVQGPLGQTYGYVVDLTAISVAEENIFYNYHDDEPASVTFVLTNGNRLILYFPENGVCSLIVETTGRPIRSPEAFRSRCNCKIGFVPILGPVEHNEPLYGPDAARRALFNYQAARNFRNIWHHYTDNFDEFREILSETWPGMDIQAPVVDGYAKPKLRMFCTEDRISREIFWAGFGFQVWCQMLTHLVQSKDNSLFLIDEPDIYLHSDLQRQLLSLLRNLGPDILIATHSTEIITDAESDDIIIINKKKRRGRRIKDPSQLAEVFSIIGSNLNPILTQLAKTRRALFVEGRDFQIVGRFARRLNVSSVSRRSEFAVVPVEGFNPERVRSLKTGMETTLGSPVRAAAIFDKDFRCDDECKSIEKVCRSFCDEAIFHERKEIENFLLVPSAIDRAAARKIADYNKRTGKKLQYSTSVVVALETFAESQKARIAALLSTERERFERSQASKDSKPTIHEAALAEFELRWKDLDHRLLMVPGKAALSAVNKSLQDQYGISVTPTAIIDAMQISEVPEEMKRLVNAISEFAATTVE